MLHTHTAGDPVSLATTIRELVRALDAALPVYDVKSMRTHLRDGIALMFVRLGATLAAVFALLGLVLTAV